MNNKDHYRNLIDQSLRDIKFIFKQIDRFKKMQMRELQLYLGKDKQSSFCTIPNLGGGGSILCGSLAWQRFYEISKRITKLEPNLEERIDLDQIKEFVIAAFANRYFYQNLEVNLESVELILEDVAEQCKQSLEDKEHYFPCIIFPKGGPDEFSIGPIKFTRTTQFLTTKKQVLLSSVKKETQAHIEFVNNSVDKGYPRERVMTPAESKKHVSQLHARVIEAYKVYPWVAQVRIINCHNKLSDELAVKAVDTALNVIRVLLGAEYTKKIRLAWSRGDVLKTASMWANADGVIRVSIGSVAMNPLGFENWFDILMRGNYHEIFGSALTGLINPVETYHLQDRFVDSINWFGDAATEMQHTSALVKYISAIERLLFGDFEIGRTKAFAKRVKLVCDIFGCDLVSGNPYDNAIDIYKGRSALLHGEFSPRDGSAKHLTLRAEELSRFCIICAAQLYPMLLKGYKNPSPKDLEVALKKIETEGIDWLLKLSGFSLSE